MPSGSLDVDHKSPDSVAMQRAHDVFDSDASLLIMPSASSDADRARPDADTESTRPAKTTPPLTLWPLVAIVFYTVSGGPFGIEPAVRAGGNFFAIAGFVLLPLMWSVPEALITAELGVAFQEPSAGVAWVEEAFGGRHRSWVAYLCGYFGWISGATGMATPDYLPAT